MGAFTSRFSLYKPGGGSTGLIVPDEILDIDKLNSNFDIIDANLGAFIATSTTLPGVPKVGQLVFETDTKRLRVYSGGSFVAPATERGSLTMYTGTNLAALDALTDGVVGDTFYMTDPGLGNAGTGTIDSLTWEAFADSGVNMNWRIRDQIVADTKAHLDTFIAAVAAIGGTDEQFRVGNRAWVSGTKRAYQFTSVAGAYKAVAGLLKPSAFALAGTGAAIGVVTQNPEGSIVIAGGGTGATALDVQIAGLFDTDFDDYDLDIQVYGASGPVTVGVVLNAGIGADNAGANYDAVNLFGQNSVAGSNTTPNLAQTSWSLVAAQFTDSVVELKRPNVNAQTTAIVRDGGTQNPMTVGSGLVQVSRVLHRSNYQASGVTIRFAGATVTGLNAIIRVTGREKG